MMLKNLFLFILFLIILVLVPFAIAKPQLYITSYCDATLEACRAQEQALDLLQEKYPYDIKVYYLYFFDISKPTSSLVLIALECANRQGLKDVYKLEIQNNLEDLSRSALKEYGKNIGLDSANLSFCIDTQATAWDVLEQIKEAEDDGVTTAPSVRFNMNMYTGSQTFTSLHELIKGYLEINSYKKTVEEDIESDTAPEPDNEAIEPIEASEEAAAETSLEETTAGEETAKEEVAEEQPFLEEVEEPLFFKVINKFRDLVISLFQ